VNGEDSPAKHDGKAFAEILADDPQSPYHTAPGVSEVQ
jgi:hypothetical protein